MDRPATGREDEGMKEIAVSEFKSRCLALIDEVDENGIVITRHGKPIARLVPMNRTQGNNGDLIGIANRRLTLVPDEELESSGDWISDEWDDTV